MKSIFETNQKLYELSTAFQNMKKFLPYTKDEYYIDAQKRCAKMISKLNKYSFAQNEKKQKLFKKLFAQYGENNTIKEGFECNLGSNIKIGNNCFFNFNLIILDAYEVEIGNHVFIAPNVLITPVYHSVKATERNKNMGKKIVIEDDVWIGAGAIIMPGVTLHKGCVVGAGSVVTNDVEANTIVVGVPAKFLKNIEQ